MESIARKAALERLKLLKCNKRIYRSSQNQRRLLYNSLLWFFVSDLGIPQPFLVFLQCDFSIIARCLFLSDRLTPGVKVFRRNASRLDPGEAALVEIFLYVLKKTGYAPGEVVHIGDSFTGDVACARMAGIKSIWLNRDSKPVPDDVASAKSLMDVAEILSTNLPNN